MAPKPSQMMASATSNGRIGRQRARKVSTRPRPAADVVMAHRCGATIVPCRAAAAGDAGIIRGVSWLALAVAALAFALALLPTRRLFLAGWRPAPLAAYLAVLMTLAIAVVLFRAGIRVLVPILLVLYIAPFVGAPEILARTITRLGIGRGGRGARAVLDGVARPPTAGSTGSPSTPSTEASPGGNEAAPSEEGATPSTGPATAVPDGAPPEAGDRDGDA